MVVGEPARCCRSTDLAGELLDSCIATLLGTAGVGSSLNCAQCAGLNSKRKRQIDGWDSVLQICCG